MTQIKVEYNGNLTCEEDDAKLRLIKVVLETGIVKVYFVCPECDCVWACGYTGYGLTRVYNFFNV